MDTESAATQVSQPSATPKPSSSGSLATIFKYIGIGTGILGIGVLIAVGGFLLGQKNNQQKALTSSPTPIVRQTAVPSLTPTAAPIASPSIIDTGVANQKRYTNPKVGISFIFSTNSLGMPFDVKEQGNKIYVYDTKYPYTQGQYVEVFQKSPQDTLSQAIQKQFLTNISANDCFVKDLKLNSYYPVSFEEKTLSFPADPSSDLPSFAQPNKCPTPYAESNGISYFLGDTKHPNIFLFLSIGQQGFPIEENGQKMWQDTIEFLN